MPDQESGSLNLSFPDKFIPAITDYKSRYLVFHGGRGGGKSHSVARILILRALESPCLILCAREFQNSINDSVLSLLSNIIDDIGLSRYFTITKNEIRAVNGSTFKFKGLSRNQKSIKSFEGADYCWIEEADSVSVDSWDYLIPTIRKEGSQIFIVFNPDNAKDYAYSRFVAKSRKDANVVDVQYWDNPFFPDTLRKEMEYCRVHNPDDYAHIWEGKPRKISHALIFKGKFIVEEFRRQKEPLYFGADWGFAKDPTTLNRCFIRKNCLYLDYEVNRVGLEIDETPAVFAEIPDSKRWSIVGDSARPETISHIRRNGFPKMTRSVKGKNSVKEGVEFMKSFDKIIIHPRCKNTIEEFENYSYKIDKTTGEILPIILDKFNHHIDAIRYALEKRRRVAKAGSVSARRLGL